MIGRFIVNEVQETVKREWMGSNRSRMFKRTSRMSSGTFKQVG